MSASRGIADSLWPGWAWPAALIASIGILLLVNPLGYIGGGWDDWQYLTAARCWVEHGPCLPHTHWEGRWPVFLPIAAITSLFGESRLTVGIWPLISSTACLFLIALVGNRILGRPIGWIAALLFAFTPAFSISLLDPSVEALELAFILGGVFCIACWTSDRTLKWAFSAGLCFAMAFQIRETSIIATALAGLFVLTRKPRPSDIAVAALGFALPMAIELLVFWNITGDPLYRRHLSLAHTQIPSSELLGPIDRSHSPFFNTAYIANWRHEPGVHVHWLIDGLLNLLINAKAGLALSLVPVLALVERKRIDPEKRRQLARLYGLAILYAAILIYVFALDPKARIMFAPLSAACLAFAIILNGIGQSTHRPVLVTACVMHVLVGLVFLYVHQRVDILEQPARRWIAALPGQIEIDPNTRKHLALVPSVKPLPGLESERKYFLHLSPKRCFLWIEASGLPKHAISVVRDQPYSKVQLVAPNLSGSLCLFHYNLVLDPITMRSAISHTRRGNEAFDILKDNRRSVIDR